MRSPCVRPIDFLGIDNDRLAIMCVFGAAAGSMIDLVLKDSGTVGKKRLGNWYECFCF